MNQTWWQQFGLLLSSLWCRSTDTLLDATRPWGFNFSLTDWSIFHPHLSLFMSAEETLSVFPGVPSECWWWLFQYMDQWTSEITPQWDTFLFIPSMDTLSIRMRFHEIPLDSRKILHCTDDSRYGTVAECVTSSITTHHKKEKCQQLGCFSFATKIRGREVTTRAASFAHTVSVFVYLQWHFTQHQHFSSRATRANIDSDYLSPLQVLWVLQNCTAAKSNNKLNG